MLGILRFVLAVLVVVAHLTEGAQFFSHWGIFAVFGFYLVSGYLMTLVLNETYAFRFSPFAANRFLRLFPIYYVVAVCSAVVILSAPNPGEFHPAWQTYRKLDVIGNGLIFPFEFYNESFRFVPPIWSVAVELVNYFLLWLFVARSRKLALATLLLALGYHAFSVAADMPWINRYAPFYAALLPFSLGACIYFAREHLTTLPAPMAKRLAATSSLVWTANLLVGGWMAGIGGKFFNWFFYVNLASLCAFVSCLAAPSFRAFFARSGKVLGDLAYPVFLTHWIVGYVVSVLVFDGRRRGLPLLAAAALPILGVSFFLSWMADRWFEPLRARIRVSISP